MSTDSAKEMVMEVFDRQSLPAQTGIVLQSRNQLVSPCTKPPLCVSREYVRRYFFFDAVIQRHFTDTWEGTFIIQRHWESQALTKTLITIMALLLYMNEICMDKMCTIGRMLKVARRNLRRIFYIFKRIELYARKLYLNSFYFHLIIIFSRFKNYFSRKMCRFKVTKKRQNFLHVQILTNVIKKRSSYFHEY